MSRILLFTDVHLDESPDNEYRWDVFKHVHKILDSDSQIETVHCLGDFIDRKDRFSSEFVNRLVNELGNLGARVPFWCLMGNHDEPLNGTPFFSFINHRITNVWYVMEPTNVGRIMLLPFARNPIKAWAEIDFAPFKAAFLHATLSGAIAENGRALKGMNLPPLPARLRLYSGDVHNPQQMNNLTYVGCPHPIKYGDNFIPRMLVLDAHSLEIVKEIPIETVRKRVIEITSVDDLKRAQVLPGDRVKLRVSIPTSEVEELGAIESAIAVWSKKVGVTVATTEVTVESAVRSGEVDTEISPEEMLLEYAAIENITGSLLDLGLELIRSV